MVMTALVWILTYAIHSTVLIAAVWVLTKVFPRMSLASQESLWKAAFFGGLATATLQLATGATPPWGHFSMPSQLDTEPVAVVTEPAPATEQKPVVERRIVKHDAGDITITTIQDAKPVATPALVVTKTKALPATPWPWVLLGLVGLGSAFALARLYLSARRLKAKLRGRRDVIEDPVLEAFFVLCQKAELGEKKKRIKLTASPHLRSPLALWSREIVLPERAIERLTPQQQEGMVAHELAHVIRRDPHWSVLTAVVEALFFFQPLNHLARRKIQEVAEFQCDDWAAKITGTGVHLAKCLAEVAAWLEDGETTSAIAVSMADDGSPIVRRITRLLHGKGARTREGGSHAMFALRVGSTIGLLGVTSWLVPGVSRAGFDDATPDASLASTSPMAFASSMQAVRPGRGEIVVRDIEGETGNRRSQVRIEDEDEVVRVEVERTPEPPPPPEPPPMPFEEFDDFDEGGDSISIHIHGGVFDPFGFPFGEGFGWLDMSIALEEGLEAELEAELEGVFGCGHDCMHHGWEHRALRERERAMRDAERERERVLRHAERERERALRAADRARELADRARAHADEARERIEDSEDSLFSL